MKIAAVVFLALILVSSGDLVFFPPAENVGKDIGSVIDREFLNLKTEQEKRSDPQQEQILDPTTFTDHRCVHEHNYANVAQEFSLNTNTDLQQVPREDKRATFAPMRFAVNFSMLTQPDPFACTTAGTVVRVRSGSSFINYTCTSADLLTPALASMIQNSFVPTAISVLQTFLQVKPVVGNLTLVNIGANCFDTPITPSLFTKGIPNSDFLLYITARPSASSSTVASAGACSFAVFNSSARFFGRPLAGAINFSPRFMQKFVTPGFSQFQFAGTVKVALHELTHALGFSSTFYNSFVDASNNRIPVIRNSTVSSVNPAGVAVTASVNKIITPKVIAWARSYYNCSTLDGVELEDDGGAGTVGSHWEQRPINGEYMQGFVDPIMSLSGLTFSLLEDMGWYQTVHSKSEYVGFGKSEGCNFVTTRRCEKDWPAGRGYACTPATSSSTCSADRMGKASCGAFIYSAPLPAEKQRFTNGSIGGPISSMDFCTFSRTFQYCQDNVTRAPDTTIGEVYSANSICFEFAKNAATIPSPRPLSSCFVKRCSATGTLEVQVLGTFRACPVAGGLLQVPEFSGVVNCPPSALICRQVLDFANAAPKTA